MSPEEILVAVVGALVFLGLAAITVVERISERAQDKLARDIADWHANGGRL